MSTRHKDWIEYWQEIAEPLEKHIQKLSVPEAESFLKHCFAFYSYMVEDFESKVTKNKDLVGALSVMAVEMQDILRASFHAQIHLTLATSAFNLRTAFEIRANLTYIYKHSNPKELIERLRAFFEYEQIVASRLSPYLTYVGKERDVEFALKHPYWKNNKTNLLKDNVDWNGENKKFNHICDDLGWSKDYINYYKIPSKFNHGSPIVANMYLQHDRTLNCIAEPRIVTNFTVQTSMQICGWLKDTCEFFGVEFPEKDYAIILMKFLEIEKTGILNS